jgi:hypothetical protein
MRTADREKIYRKKMWFSVALISVACDKRIWTDRCCGCREGFGCLTNGYCYDLQCNVANFKNWWFQVNVDELGKIFDFIFNVSLRFFSSALNRVSTIVW